MIREIKAYRPESNSIGSGQVLQDPYTFEKMKLVVIKQTSKQYQAVKTQLFRNDIQDIVIATDAGREGELVARWILDKSGCRSANINRGTAAVSCSSPCFPYTPL